MMSRRFRYPISITRNKALLVLAEIPQALGEIRRVLVVVLDDIHTQTGVVSANLGTNGVEVTNYGIRNLRG
jgi:hypothetical protein